MSDTTTPITNPVQNPTWYGDIRYMFNATDVSHMRGQGLDLASYTDVVAHAGDIYQQTAVGNMPPGSPWSPAYVTTFLNWMNNGYPKGIPKAARIRAALTLRAGTAPRLRKEITALSSDELQQLEAAFTAIMALPITDPNSYFVQAGYHWWPAPNTYCQHHVPGYNPWHRAYMLTFENALRSVAGCENLTLPYWDITTPFPDVLKNPPFASYTFPEDVGPGYPKGYVTQRYDYPKIQANLLQYNVTADLQRALTQTDWEDFHGFWSGAPYDTIIAAHDGGHNSIGPTMADQNVAAFDPVFWFFHCNWDRLFWEWQTQVGGTNLNGLISTINQQTDPTSYQVFTDPALEVINPFTVPPLNLKTTTVIDSVNDLGVDYTTPSSASAVTMVTKTKLAALTSDTFGVETKRVLVSVKGLNRIKIPGSFSVHLTKDGKILSSKGLFQPSEVEKCPTCVENAIVHFDFDLPMETVLEGKLGVWVEPQNKEPFGDRFPNKLMGNPTVVVHFPLNTE